MATLLFKRGLTKVVVGIGGDHSRDRNVAGGERRTVQIESFEVVGEQVVADREVFGGNTLPTPGPDVASLMESSNADKRDGAHSTPKTRQCRGTTIGPTPCVMFGWSFELHH